MKVTETEIAGLLIIEPDVFTDDRGYFLETYNIDRFEELGIMVTFCQDNESRSKKGVLRGLHFQEAPYAQGKLVRVIKGRVLDVAVDLRKESMTYGKHYTTELSEQNKKIFWIPPGFAHGFVALEDDTVFVYKCTEVYNRESERCIRWDDPDLAIDWGIKDPLVSEKDRKGMLFSEYSSGKVTMNYGI